MKILYWFIFFINLFLLIPCAFSSETDSQLSSASNLTNNQQERYLRLDRALKDIEPQNIIKIILAFTYKHEINKLNGLSYLPGVEPDLQFYRKLFPYVQDNLIVTDDHEMNKTDLLNAISNRISNPNKNTIILMYAGHGSRTGNIFLGSYSRQCKHFFETNLARKDYTNIPNDLFVRPPLQNNVSDFWERYCSNYVLTPDDIITTFKNKKVVFINDSCFSGIYEQWMGSPLSVFIYGAKSDGTAHEYDPNKSYQYLKDSKIIPRGSYLNYELKKRLLPEEGCRYDGLQPDQLISSEDLILNLYEWTVNISNVYGLPNTVPRIFNLKRTYNPVKITLDQKILALPMTVYTQKECKKDIPLDQQKWTELSDQSRQFSQNVKYSNPSFRWSSIIFEIFNNGLY